MTTERLSFRVQALLSMQRALWDAVTPGLRGVTIHPEHSQLRARFLFENEPNAEDREIVSEVETQVLADFNESVRVQFNAVHIPPDMPRDLLPDEEWVYLRRESGATGNW